MNRIAQEMVLAMGVAVGEGATGFHLVWLKPGGDYGDAFDCDDILQMTEAVNDSALKARIEAEGLSWNGKNSLTPTES